MPKATEHFSFEEIQCHCGCGQAIINAALLEMAEALRAYLGQPMITHCINRCVAHNAAVGGEKNSYHIKGWAMDFHCAGISMKELHEKCIGLWKSRSILTGGLGIYEWGIHIDSGPYRTWNG
jgi:uncharacterized protein YcbK (DUF882 family)